MLCHAKFNYAQNLLIWGSDFFSWSRIRSQYYKKNYSFSHFKIDTESTNQFCVNNVLVQLIMVLEIHCKLIKYGQFKKKKWEWE